MAESWFSKGKLSGCEREHIQGVFALDVADSRPGGLFMKLQGACRSGPSWLQVHFLFQSVGS